MLSRQVDGLILATAMLKDPALTDLINRNIAVVMVNRRDDKSRAPSVVTDDERGIALAVEHLYSLGHRDIAHIAGPQTFSTGVTRLRGFVGAMAARGLTVDPSRIVVADSYAREGGSRAAVQLLAHRTRPTALVAANDLLALGCYDVLKSMGMNCPIELSITGYNDMPLVDMVSPAPDDDPDPASPDRHRGGQAAVAQARGAPVSDRRCGAPCRTHRSGIDGPPPRTAQRKRRALNQGLDHPVRPEIAAASSIPER